MWLIVELYLGNAAMAGEEGYEETAHILEDLARRIRCNEVMNHKLFDVNGNTIGRSYLKG